MNEKKRLVIISLGLFSLFSLLLTNYFRIQIVEEEKWSKQARLQHEIIVQEPFRRGTFYSNTTLKQGYSEAPRPFVFDVTKFHLFIDPLSIPVDFREEVAAVVVDQLSLDSEAVYREFEKKSRSRRVAMWLDREQKDRLLKWWRPYARQHKIATNAFFFVTDYQRSYPYGKLLGQVLHTIRDIKDESTHEGLPTGGLEAYFNTYLRGKMGKRKLLRSPLNRLEIDQLIEPPEDGADIYLTINHCLQAIVEEELEKGVTSAQAKGGWAVMMDPYSG